MTITNKNKIIAIVPAFNEANTITKVVDDLKRYVQEVIVIDDYSSDETKSKALNAGAFVVCHEKNLGYDKTLEDGFREATKHGADIIITFDADGQHKTEDINKLTEPIINGEVNMVIAQRNHLNHFCEKIFALYTKFFYGIRDPLCGLKAYHGEVYKSIGHFDTLNSIGTQLMIEAIHKGFKVQFVSINTEPRHGQSRFYYRRFRANYKIFIAMIKVIIKSLSIKIFKENNKI